MNADPDFVRPTGQRELWARSGYAVLAEEVWKRPALKAVLQQFGVGEPHFVGNNWMNILLERYPQMKVTFSTEAAAESAAIQAVNTLDPNTFFNIVKQGYTTWQADWTAGAHNDSFFGVPLQIVVAGISLAMAPAFAAIAGQIGVAVVGSPGVLANTVGKIALSTAMNKGNVAQAIRNTGINFVSGNIGGNIGTYVDSEMAGKMASAATSAALSGGDINKAVTNTIAPYALQTGVNSMSDLWDDVTDFFGTGDNSDLIPDSFAPGVGEHDGYYTVVADGGTYIMYDDGSIQFLEDNGKLYALNEDGSTGQYDPQTGAELGTVPDGEFDWGDFFGGAVAVMSAVTTNALKLLTAWNTMGKKQARPGATTVLPNGGRVTPNRNGTLTTVLNGRSTVTKMPIGQPYTFTDGTTVMNNADGTTTTITADGQSYTTPTGQAGVGAAGGGSGLLVVGAIAAGLLLMGGNS